MVTGDFYYPAMSTAYLSDIIGESTQILKFEGNTLEDVRSMMRVQIAELKTGIVEMQQQNYNRFHKKSFHNRTTLERNTLLEKNLTKLTSFQESNSIFDIYDLNYSVVINGTTLDFILKDENLRANFTFILTYCANMVAYQLTSMQKAALVCLMKLNLLDNPKILAIGDGYNDIMMMQAADVSIEVTEPEGLAIHAGDIEVSRWSTIHRLVFVK